MMVAKVSGTGSGKSSALVVLVAASLVAAAPARAQTAEQDFLRVAPLPDGIDAVEPIPGAMNVRFQDCSNHWPEGYRAWRAESVAVAGHASRGDIYGWLRTRQAFAAGTCDCAAKVAPWDDVMAIYAALAARHGPLLLKHTAVYEDQARVYRAAVEIMCGGPF